MWIYLSLYNLLLEKFLESNNFVVTYKTDVFQIICLLNLNTTTYVSIFTLKTLGENCHPLEKREFIAKMLEVEVKIESSHVNLSESL